MRENQAARVWERRYDERDREVKEQIRRNDILAEELRLLRIEHEIFRAAMQAHIDFGHDQYDDLGKALRGEF